MKKILFVILLILCCFSLSFARFNSLSSGEHNYSELEGLEVADKPLVLNEKYPFILFTMDGVGKTEEEAVINAKINYISSVCFILCGNNELIRDMYDNNFKDWLNPKRTEEPGKLYYSLYSDIMNDENVFFKDIKIKDSKKMDSGNLLVTITGKFNHEEFEKLSKLKYNRNKISFNSDIFRVINNTDKIFTKNHYEVPAYINLWESNPFMYAKKVSDFIIISCWNYYIDELSENSIDYIINNDKSGNLYKYSGKYVYYIFDARFSKAMYREEIIIDNIQEVAPWLSDEYLIRKFSEINFWWKLYQAQLQMGNIMDFNIVIEGISKSEYNEIKNEMNEVIMIKEDICEDTRALFSIYMGAEDFAKIFSLWLNIDNNTVLGYTANDILKIYISAFAPKDKELVFSSEKDNTLIFRLE